MLLGTFVVGFLGIFAITTQTYPDRVAVPRTFEGGLEEELGGPKALRVSCEQYVDGFTLTIVTGTSTWRGVEEIPVEFQRGESHFVYMGKYPLPDVSILFCSTIFLPY